MSPERKCGERAEALVYWPGRAALQCCEAHTAQAIRIAAAMGLYVTVTVAGPNDRCTQIVTDRAAGGAPLTEEYL